MIGNNRGQIRVIEAFLSMIVLFSALALCSALVPMSGSYNHRMLSSVGMQVLVQLDSDGNLGTMIEEENWAGLASALRLALPLGVSYNLTVYDENMQQVNAAQVSNGLVDGDVVVVEYLCANHGAQFHCFVLRLQLAVVR